MNKERITVFAVSPDYKGYSFNCDSDKLLKYYKVHGYGFMLTFVSEIEELINELKAIKYVVDVLTQWQSNDWFVLRETTYKINWSNCYDDKIQSKYKEVTLPQAKKLYKDIKAKYDLLIDIIQETFRVHNEDPYGNVYNIDEFLTDIEI